MRPSSSNRGARFPYGHVCACAIHHRLDHTHGSTGKADWVCSGQTQAATDTLSVAPGIDDCGIKVAAISTRSGAIVIRAIYARLTVTMLADVLAPCKRCKPGMRLADDVIEAALGLRTDASAAESTVGIYNDVSDDENHAESHHKIIMHCASQHVAAVGAEPDLVGDPKACHGGLYALDYHCLRAQARC
eukprot:m.70314 g.70314  ORF g.70314 m.70314 type:complete len:189 (-) comp7587_c0_seq1:581-1147(-)